MSGGNCARGAHGDCLFADCECSCHGDSSALWHHLIEDHGMGLSMLHGNPHNIHGALVAGGACEAWKP